MFRFALVVVLVTVGSALLVSTNALHELSPRIGELVSIVLSFIQ